MNNFYELFEISNSASINDVKLAYKNKINEFNYLPFLTDEQIYQIKTLKIGLHILTNNELRKKYKIDYI